MMMSPKRTSAGYYVFEIDWTAKLGFRIDRSAETKSLREYNALVALLWELRENGQVEVLRAFARGEVAIAELKQAKKAKRLKSDTLLADLALYQPLWHRPAVCPRRKDPTAAHGEACLGAIDRVLPRLGKSPATRTRYAQSFAKLRAVAGDELGLLPDSAQVRDLESIDWTQVRARWTVTVKRRAVAGDSQAARRAGYVLEQRPASAADWNHLARALSAFLSALLGDVYHPRRRAIIKRLEREKETARTPTIAPVFWDLVRALPEHARAPIVVLAATGMRIGEYLAPTLRLRPEGHAIDTTGKTGEKTYQVAPELWPWVEHAVPPPLQRRWLYLYFKRAARAVGRPELTIHDLRHLFAQVAKAEGVPTADTQQALGQATPGITRAYEMEDRKAEVAQAVARGLTKRREAPPRPTPDDTPGRRSGIPRGPTNGTTDGAAGGSERAG